MPQRPNVLFLMMDHANARVTAPGSQCRKPHIDALAADGLRCARAYTCNAICSPSRASLMTGQYASTHGVWDCTHTQRRQWVDLHDNPLQFSQVFAAAGYATGYFGKWHVEQTGALERFGWQECDTQCAGMRGSVTAGTDVTIPAEGYRDYLLAGVSDDLPEHHPAFDRGIDFIARHAEAAHDGTPFFCFVSVSEPHDPYIAPRKFFEQYDLDAIELSATLHDEPTGKPEVVARMARVWENMTDTQWRVSTAAYLAVMSFLDAEVGRIVAALKNAGLYDDTIIVLSSDHGDMLGAHGLATKGVGTPYEEVYNIPLIVRVPGRASGEQNDAVISIVDIGPTLLELCGLDALPAAQGRSFRAVLDGSAAMQDWQDAYAEFYGQRFVYTQRIVWHADWKYVFTPGGVDELYNLADDPDERYNLVDEPACRAVLVDMCTRMWRTMKTIGDDSLYNTQYATLRTAPVGPLVSGDA